MDERTFQSMMLRARTLAHLDAEHTDYWTGYQRGLRRHYHGERFGTDEEHAQWMAMADAPDRTQADRGRGYRDGFAGRAPSIQLGDSGLLGDLTGDDCR